MLTRIFLMQSLLCISLTSIAQMKIGSNPTALNSSSMLELEGTNKGFVLPRVSLTNVTSTSPLASTALNSTMVYNTNNSVTGGIGKGVYYWDSTNVKWVALTPFQAFGTTNYVAKWTSSSVIGTSTILYDNGTNIGINTTTPQNSLDIVGAQAIGSYAGNTVAPASGLIVSGNVGIGTSSPATGAKLDVAGGVKVGSVGTVTKTIVNFSASVNTTVVPQFNALTVLGLTVLGLNNGSNYTDVTVTMPNTLSSTQATVVVSPAFDLPGGIGIASSRLVSSNQVRIRLVNSGTSNQAVTGNFNISVIEF